MNTNSLIVRALVRMASAVALVAAAGTAQAVAFVSISVDPPVAAGGSFSLWLEDDAVPMGGFTGADILVAWDAAVLSLVGSEVQPSFAFGPAVLQSDGPFTYPGDPLTYSLFTIDRTVPAGSYGTEILRLDFTVSAAATVTNTVVDFYPGDPSVTVGGYYQFEALGTLVGITPVPEPATLAMMLAGLGLVAGWSARRRH